jgi:hypothetical protein
MSYGFTPKRHTEINNELERISTYLTELAQEVNLASPIKHEDAYSHVTLTLAAEYAARARFHISTLQEAVSER